MQRKEESCAGLDSFRGDDLGLTEHFKTGANASRGSRYLKAFPPPSKQFPSQVETMTKKIFVFNSGYRKKIHLEPVK